MANITYLSNTDKTFDVSSGYIEVYNSAGAGHTFTYTFPASSNKTLDEVITDINASFDTQDSLAYRPHLNADLYENISIVKASDDTTLMTVSVELDGAFNLMYLLGAYNKPQSGTVAPLNFTNITEFTYWGVTRLPSQTRKTISGYAILGGFGVRQVIEIERTGKDFISYSDTESTPYQAMGGFTYPYRLHESQKAMLSFFINQAIGEELEFANDTYNIGGGYTFFILPYKQAGQNIVYDFLDIIEKKITLLKKGDLYAI